MISFVVIIGLLVIVKILTKKIKVIKSVVEKVLKKLMWSTVIRALLQGYLMIALSSVYAVAHFSELTPMNKITSSMMIFITVAAPVFSAVFIQKS